MSQRKLSRSLVETILLNPVRNHGIDFARLGTTFTGVSGTTTDLGGGVQLGTEYIERWFFHARGPAVFTVSQTTPELDTRFNHLEELGNFYHAMRYEVTSASGPIAADEYYLVEGYLDGGDVRGMNWGASGRGDINFPDNDLQGERNKVGSMMISFWMRTNIAVGNHFSVSVLDEYNGQSFVGQVPITASTGNHGQADGQWHKFAAFWRHMPMLEAAVSGVPPAIAGGTNSMPTLAPGRRMIRWGIGLSGGSNYRLATQSDEGLWAPRSPDIRFLPDDHTGNAGVPGTPLTDFAETNGNYVEISRPFMEAGLGHSLITPTDWGLEKLQCDKYLQTSYQDGDFPGDASAPDGRIVMESSGHSNSGYTLKKWVPLRPDMVNTPTVEVYSPVTGTSNRVRMNGVDVIPDSIEVYKDGFIVEATAAANTVRNMEFHFLARADLI